MLVQNTELDKKINCEHSHYILKEKGVYGDRLAACINDSITKWKFTQRKILKILSFIYVNFSTLFYKRIQQSAKRISYRRVFYTQLVCFSSHLQAALVTNALIPTSIFVSYYCRMSSSDSEKGEIEISLIEISLIVVGAPKLKKKKTTQIFKYFYPKYENSAIIGKWPIML